jgi:hypothetical protein
MAKVPMSNTKARIWLRSLLGVAAIVAVPVVLVIALRSAYQSSSQPGGIDRNVFDYTQPKETVPPPGGTVTAPAAKPEKGVTRVYECRKNGQVIYSGQPCGPDSVTHDVAARRTNTYTSEAYEVSPSQAAAPAPGKPVRRERTTTAPATRDNSPRLSDAKKDECAQAQEEIDQINARMRQPYTSAEGEFFRERLRKLNDKQYELKCGR